MKVGFTLLFILCVVSQPLAASGVWQKIKNYLRPKEEVFVRPPELTEEQWELFLDSTLSTEELEWFRNEFGYEDLNDEELKQKIVKDMLEKYQNSKNKAAKWVQTLPTTFQAKQNIFAYEPDEYHPIYETQEAETKEYPFDIAILLEELASYQESESGYELNPKKAASGEQPTVTGPSLFS